MKKFQKRKISITLLVMSGAMLSACNSGQSSDNLSSQNISGGAPIAISGAPLAAEISPQQLFSTQPCLTATMTFSNGVYWTSGSLDVSNSCSAPLSLSGQTISFTSQDKSGKAVALSSLDVWYDQATQTSYKVTFANGGGNTQIGTFTAGNSNPQILANTKYSFVGGFGLNNSAFDLATAKNSLAFKGAMPTPTPSPAPTPVAKATLNVVVDTSTIGCGSKITCSGLNVNISDSTGVSVQKFTVPASGLGTSYTQPITNLDDGKSYTVAASAIGNTTISYSPAAASKVSAASSSTVTIKYAAPVVTTGRAEISLASYLSSYSDNLQVQLINKTTGSIVNTYSIKQGGSFTTEALPVTDATHVYQVKMTTGIADPLQGLYYLESGLAEVKITNSGTPATLAIAMQKSTVANNALNVVVSGLQGSDKAGVAFSDATNKYSYVNTTAQANGTLAYKVESNLNLGVSVQASGSYKVNPINHTQVISSAKTISAAFESVTTPAVANIVTAYLLIDSTKQLQQYLDDLKNTAKVNFNRVVFSFVKPSLDKYVTGSLANTGIMGYFTTGTGDPVADFKLLQQAVTNSKAKGIQAFLSVGGWNYSCNPAFYTNCSNEANATLDWFPETTETNAAKSYANLVKLTNDLGMDGIDIDYEEFWHADLYAQSWKNDKYQWGAVSALGFAANDYNAMLAAGLAAGQTYVMPKTVAKLDSIVQAITANIKASSNPSIKLAGAVPPVGATPIMDMVYGDSSKAAVYQNGGVWWKGNLKGLMYNLAWKTSASVDAFDSMGLMTYDLAGNDSPFGGSADLPTQVDQYVGLYNQFMKNPDGFKGSMAQANEWSAIDYRPAHLNVKAKIQFGFEVNYPAYPTDGNVLVLKAADVTNILAKQATQTNGVIVWQMYSIKPAGGVETAYVLQQSCKTFLANDSRYDCAANFPSAAKQ